MNDKAIEFETTIYKVKSSLTRLKKIGLRIEKYERLVDEVIETCNKETDYNMENVFGAAENFSEGMLANSYIKAISKLESIFLELSKYEIYLKVAAFNQILKEFLNSKNKEKIKFIELKDQLRGLLNDLKKSGTLDYQVEGALVEDIYFFTYQLIQEEIKCFGTSSLLSALKQDEIHKYNLDKQIRKELETLNLKKEKYSLLKLRKNEIDTQEGLHATYLGEYFILNLMKATMSEQDRQNLLEEMAYEITFAYKQAKNIEKDIDKNRESITENSQKIQKYLKKIYKNIALFATSASITAGLITGSLTLGKKWACEKKYNVTTYSFSSIDGELPIKTEKSYSIENTIQLYEYKPFKEADSFNYYTRTVNTFDLSSLKERNLEDYLNINLEALRTIVETGYDYKENLSVSDLYQETLFIVEKKVTDEENVEITYNAFSHVLIFLDFLIIDVLIELILAVGIAKIENRKYLEWNLLSSLRKMIVTYRKIIVQKQKIANTEEELKNLDLEMKNLFLENRDLLQKIPTLLTVFEGESNFREVVESIKKNLSRFLKL